MTSKPKPGKTQHAESANATPSSDVTRLLRQWQGGDNSARDDLIALMYPDLRRLANCQLAGMAQMTLQPTALVHEAWLKLNNSEAPDCEGRAHFMSLAARVMRQVAIDHARRRTAGKRDGGVRITLDERVQGNSQPDLDVLALDGALSRLAIVENDKARIIEM
ncbi:MAG TPA: ECF-type sigma factor, partial [Rudaea sp.]|nr:ECF-type sigma factor [Rudaea sp.]